jgi:aspartate/methionine/tyrosine aminotransferase
MMSDKTRMLILNNPHNPTGKVFTRAEMDAIADVVRKFPT